MEKELTPRQKKVFQTIKAAERITILDIARNAFPGVRPIAKANSWARNQLRGLVARKMVKKVARGTYKANV